MADLISRLEDAEGVTYTYVGEGQTGDTVVTILKTTPASWIVQLPAEVQAASWQDLVLQQDIDLGVT